MYENLGVSYLVCWRATTRFLGSGSMDTKVLWRDI